MFKPCYLLSPTFFKKILKKFSFYINISIFLRMVISYFIIDIVEQDFIVLIQMFYVYFAMSKCSMYTLIQMFYVCFVMSKCSMYTLIQMFYVWFAMSKCSMYTLIMESQLFEYLLVLFKLSV